MAKSDLLKQAIADARAVKETALANAKIALQEAFTPRVAEMFSQQMESELEGDEGMDMPANDMGMENEGYMYEEDEMEAGAEMGDEETGAEAGDDFNWTDDTLSASVGGNDYSFQIGMAGGDEELEDGGAAPAAGDESFEEEGGDEDLNLESIIRELEEEMDMEANPDGMPVDEGDMSVEDDMAAEGYMYEEDEISSDMGDEMSNQNIDEIIEAILREQAEDEEEPVTAEQVEDLENKVQEQEEELKEAYRTVRQLKSVINEVNLLNAKLLYTNKLFRNFELNEGQKMKVIENFDRAGTTREVKLVFTTLAESFKRPTKKRVVRESYASRPVATTAPTYAPILNEGFELADRWKKLAGLL